MRTPRQHPAMLLIVGSAIILVGVLRWANPSDYLPTDWRSEPWFYPVTSLILITIGLVSVVAGIQGLRKSRNEQR